MLNTQPDANDGYSVSHRSGEVTEDDIERQKNIVAESQRVQVSASIEEFADLTEIFSLALLSEIS